MVRLRWDRGYQGTVSAKAMGSNAIGICAGASDLSMVAVFLSSMETPQSILWVGDTLYGGLDDFKVVFGAKINLLGVAGTTSGGLVVKDSNFNSISCIFRLGFVAGSNFGSLSSVWLTQMLDSRSKVGEG